MDGGGRRASSVERRGGEKEIHPGEGGTFILTKEDTREVPLLRRSS